MTHRFNKRGSFVIDKRFKGIGRIRRASGTSDGKTFRDIQSMLKQLYDAPRHQILREIRDGILSPMEVYGYWTEGRLDHLPSAVTLRTVIPTIPDWIETHQVTPYTKQNYKNQIKRFCDFTKPDLPIQDIPKALKRYKKHCVKQGIERTFNACRTVMLAYFNRNHGKSHTLWKQVSDIRQLTIVPKRQAPHLTVEETLQLTEHLPEPYANIVKAMVTAGMSWKEVTGEWSCEKDRVVIKGTKTASRDRVVPLIQKIHKPTRASSAFRKQLKKVRPDISPYSFRRTYAHWMELAQIPRSRRRMYLGHSGPKDTTDIYERHEVEAFLEKDGRKLRNWILQQQVELRRTPKKKDVTREKIEHEVRTMDLL